MAKKNPRIEELRDSAKSMLPDAVITMGYMEHMMDLIAQILIDRIDGTATTEAQNRVQALRNLMTYSSVDFSNLSDPLEAYKLPKAADEKARVRHVQNLYLLKQQAEGVFGQ